MSTHPSENTLELVQQIVDLNCDGERLVALSKDQVLQTLEGSGLSEAEVERALAELVERGELAETDEGYRCAARRAEQ
ncbi:hypothetical protein [Halobellus sp. EA9]|uniref:hypothetical protein n=1 Tax=Halobellus sp. EA9 TaxID=3421647 RepID=UPI003EBF18A6